jgi:hypothetical protein
MKNQKLKSDGETVSACVETWEMRQIQKLAEKKGLSISAIVRMLIKSGLKSQ